MVECIYKTCDGYCTKHSDGIEFREPCVEGPCDDERLPTPTPCDACHYGGRHLDAPPCDTCPAGPRR